MDHPPAQSSPARSALADLTRLGPHDAAHVPAFRVAISIAVPLGVLLATDHLAWSAYAAFGAFAAVYGRGATRPVRRRMQAQAAVSLFLAVTLGTALSLVDSRSWWVVLGGSLVTASTALAADALRWRPPGGLFTLFGFAVCAMTPGNTASAVGVAAALSAGSAVFAIAVSQVGRRGDDPVPRAASTSGGARAAVPTDRRRLALRFVLAPAVAGGIATGVGISHPYWAMVAAVSVLTAPSVRHIASRGVLRATGTVVGLGVTAVLLAPAPGPTALVVMIVVAQWGAELFVMRNYGLAAVFITPLALMMGQLVHPLPTGELLEARGLETLIGVTVGIAVAWATRPGRRGARSAHSNSLSPQ